MIGLNKTTICLGGDRMSETVNTGTDDLLGELDDGVLTLTMNRPEARNAMSGEMTAAMSEQLASAELNPEVRCMQEL
jgi:2-(1,2-epoxy-1,2-dihydrophenyl)acetyl-CoA isomerase